MTKLKDFLQLCGRWEICRIVVWYKSDDSEPEWEEPAWEGFLLDVPYWIAESEFAHFDPEDEQSAISFRDNIDGKGHSGIVVILKDE